MTWPTTVRRLAALAAAAVVHGDMLDSWPVSCSKSCNGKNLCEEVCAGEQVQNHACPYQADCPAENTYCPADEAPTPCVFGNWEAWSAPQGCIGLCTRTRKIAQHNKCGGPACEGPLADAKYCEGVCQDTPQDCLLGNWGAWSACNAVVPLQRERNRSVLRMAARGGAECKGSLVQTEDCGTHMMEIGQDCEMTEWMEWSPCTKKCGGGERGRLRAIKKHALNGGRLCSGTLGETSPCNTGPCAGTDAAGPQNCTLAEWSDWGACDAAQQKQRTRTVVQPASGSGKACEGPVREVLGCTDDAKAEGTVTNCAFADWSEWHLCDQSCDGGQTIRTRQVATPASGGGTPCTGGLQETTACNTVPCENFILPCRPSEWSEWSSCTTSCGPGSRTRSRTYSEANAGGQGCTLSLSETDACPSTPQAPRQACPIQDCEMSEWSAWRPCTKTCQGGITERDRHIVKHATVGGKACELNHSQLLEVKECGSGSCDKEANCIDGQWGDWGGWTECTKTCRGGFQLASRRIVVEANKCGKPAEGQATISQRCNDDVECTGAVDCELTAWGNWSACDQPCTGVRERSRSVKVHPQYGGVPCGSEMNATSLSEMEHCPAAAGQECEVPKPDGCQFSEWSNWTTCSATCGGGQMTRSRKALAGDDGSLSPCEGQTMQTAACGTAPCGIKADCKYGEWSEWGNCTKCGGQKFRQRSIVQLPSFGGLECQASDVKETGECDRDCGEKLFYCEWSDWTGYSGCTATCGVGVHFRKRLLSMTDQKPLDPVAIASTKKDCSGELIDIEQCPTLPTCDACTPQDCELGDWSEWSSPLCEGICTRSREVKTPNNECGQPCQGSLNGTKHCAADCHSKDCTLGAWSAWSSCPAGGQKYAERSILDPGAYNGQACAIEGLNKTASCMTGPNAPVDCQLSDWTAWGPCSKTCGQGQQTRTREITTQASKGGAACLGSLGAVQSCNLEECSASEIGLVNCQLGAWSLWQECEAGQQVRTREVLHPASLDGEPCQDNLKETQGCGEASEASRNCIFSTWSEWSVCPATCGGGQSHRSRVIESHARGDGLQCSGTMLETQPCGEGNCPGSPNTVCQYTDWSAWGACSKSCGEGFQARTRNISAPAVAGLDGCQGAMKESQSCHGNCDMGTDCVWGSWSAWSDCVQAQSVCGTGFKLRNRTILVMPANGGKLCDPRHMEEMLPVTNCNGQPECCIDGAWDDWQAWGGCSATCGTGTKKRSRDLKIKETFCGKPAKGSGVEYDKCSAKPCEADVDCEFGAWSAPSACSAPCNGQQKSHREIVQNSTGKGKPCNGATEMTMKCNPAEGQPEPSDCANKEHKAIGVQDCVMSDWSAWSECSATCEHGYQLRDRRVEVNPERGGRSCPPELQETRSCNPGVTCFPDRADCVWEAWTAWSACDAFEKITRTRGIAQHAANGGLDCDGSYREIKGCEENPTGSCPVSWYNCSWSVWSSWSACSTTCGRAGVRTRSRLLQVSNETVEAPAAPISDVGGLGGGSMLDYHDDSYYSGSQDKFGGHYSSHVHVSHDYTHSQNAMMEPFDCSEGRANWKAGWSTAMKKYCCKHHNFACEDSDPYDCDAGVNNWRNGWSDNKKQWCCAEKYVGCEDGMVGMMQDAGFSGGAYEQSDFGTIGSPDSIVRRYDLAALEAKVHEAEARRAKELQGAFVLGCGCLAVLGFAVRSRARASAVDEEMLPRYDAVPQRV